MCKPCVGAKLVLRFQALIAHAFLNRSIPFLYHKSACTSGSICRKRISFISRFGAIVSHFVRGNIFFYSPCSPGALISGTPVEQMGSQWSLAPYYRSILMCSVLCRFFSWGVYTTCIYKYLM